MAPLKQTSKHDTAVSGGYLVAKPLRAEAVDMGFAARAL
jgi:hypothetical protein